MGKTRQPDYSSLPDQLSKIEPTRRAPRDGDYGPNRDINDVRRDDYLGVDK